MSLDLTKAGTPTKNTSVLAHPMFWLVVSLALFAATRVFFYLNMEAIPLTGDEAYQMAVVRNGFSIGRGTFMPGIAYFVRIAGVFFDPLTLPDARLLMGLGNVALMLAAVFLIVRTMGAWYAAAFVFALTFASDWNIVSFTLWGDHAGSLLLVINFLYMYWLIDKVTRKEPVGIAHYAVLAVVFAASLYVRQNFIIFPLIAFVLSAIVFLVIYFKNGETRVRVFLVPMVYAVALLALVPWSIALSKHLGGFRVAPISQEISVAVHYGKNRLMKKVNKVIAEHEKALAEIPGKAGTFKRKGNTFLVVHQAARIQARQQDRPLLEIYKEYRSYALEGVTAQHVLVRVKDSWHRYLYSAGKFSTRFFDMGKWRYKLPKTVRYWMVNTHMTVFAGAFFLALAVTIIPFWGTLQQQLMVVAYKGVFCFACLNPFVHRTIARHHQFVVPLMVLGALLLFRECLRVARRSSYSGMATAEKVLFFAQAAGGLAVLGLALVIAFYSV